MKDALIVSALSLLPRNRAAAGMGWFARTGFSGLLTRLFVKIYGVDLSEATGDIGDYPTLEALFTRTLNDGARPIDDTAEAIVSPVDGRVAAVGSTTKGSIEVAPGRPLDIADLIGAEPGNEYDVAVLYLSPKDYHRVHVPKEGAAVSWSYLPGTLWPVFPAAVRRVDNLFSRNERLDVVVDTTIGPMHVVLVGAFGVGRITAAVTDVVTNTGGRATSATLEPNVEVARGDWLGTFHLGSTVILVCSHGRVSWEISPGEALRFGRRIGAVV